MKSFYLSCILLLCFTCCLGKQRCLRFESPEVPQLTEVWVNEKNHYDAGYSYGRQAYDVIHLRFSRDKRISEKLVPWSKTKEGRESLDRLMKIHKEAYPEYFEEIRGIAAGCEIDVEQIFMFSLIEELSYYMPYEYKYQRIDHCSDVLIKEDDHMYIAHNEDGAALDIDTTVFVHFLIQDEKQVYCNFTAYSYAGELSTSAFGFNPYVAFSMNHLQTVSANMTGIGRNFIARRLLDSKSMKEMKQILFTNEGFVAHNYQIMSLTEREAFDVEVAPFGVYAVYTPSPNRSHFHANMFNIAMVDDIDEDSSLHRMKRAAEIMPAITKKDALAVLGDTEDPKFPIYQHGGYSSLYTLHTSLYDWEAKTVTVYEGNPKNEKIRLQYYMLKE